MTRCLAVLSVIALASYSNADDLSRSLNTPLQSDTNLRRNATPNDADDLLRDRTTQQNQTFDTERHERSFARRPEQSPDDQSLRQRIDQLEQRIAVLERQRFQPQYPQTTTTSPTPYGYRYQAPVQPVPTPPIPAPIPAPPLRSQEPSTAPSIPAPRPSYPDQNWQRFNFNGQWFYIVPVENSRDQFDPRSR